MALVLNLGLVLQRKPLLQWRITRSSLCSCASVCSDAKPLKLLDSSQSKLVSAYIDTLLRWNERMNLISASSKSDVMERHIGDSLALLPVIEKHYSCDQTLKLVDVGSGAGLPGIVIGIARPSWEVTLIEATLKKCAFLDEVLNTLCLKNVTIARGRAEEKGQDVQFREQFDVAIARAVGEMRVLAELCLPLISIGGIMVAAKGANPQEEAADAEEALTLLGGSLVTISEVASESELGTRTAIVCSKRFSTPEKYPRRSGMPAKRPIGVYRGKR